ncbi:helix-turn-helix domain-containing protein [Paracoccus litorisediminis]|uniref:Helix-turn-helix domain-containing protein n=1 Tax=Paracoccus litorisediminis TaxID=2006130 RepID=A0A844HTG6_9RHOB|nr:helix-turn-helix domain-containing protein [Paracoccus litorisediminis]
MRGRRDELNLSQCDLASIAGIDQGNLSKTERGISKATLETYLRLCKGQGVTSEDATCARPSASTWSRVPGHENRWLDQGPDHTLSHAHPT